MLTVDFIIHHAIGIREDDRLTLLEHLQQHATESTLSEIEETAIQLEIHHLLALPLVTLSNGQTRRARIARALLAGPEMLILEEPFSKIDLRECVKCVHHSDISPITSWLRCALACPHFCPS